MIPDDLHACGNLAISYAGDISTVPEASASIDDLSLTWIELSRRLENLPQANGLRTT